MAKTKFGYMPCPDCAERVVVKANDQGTLGYSCDECDSTGYARKGAGNYEKWLGRITRTAAPAPAPGKGGEGTPPKPAAAPAKSKGSILDDIV